MTQLRDDLITVEVPSMAFGLMVNNYGNESELMYMLSMEDIADDDNTEETLITKKLPPGSWQFICTTREATDEEGKRKAEAKDQPIPFGFTYDYLRSLLTSKGLDVSKNYCLLKKVG